MFTIPSSWELASLVCKLLVYLGTACIAGGSFCLWRFSDGRRQTVQQNLVYVLSGALVGFQAVVFNFLIQVGLINDKGLVGMFDWDMASLLIDTQLGDVTFFRLTGFVLALIGSLVFLRKANQATRPPTQGFFTLTVAVAATALLCISTSFRMAGHVSVLSVTAQVAIVIHVIVFSIWIGSLYPLYRLTLSNEPESLRFTLKRFGDDAIGILLLLVLSGTLMLLQVLQQPAELISSAYGISLLSKLLLVLALVGVAAINKLYLVPQLVSATAIVKLRRSIRYEMLLASLILLLTSYLSTIIGPMEH